MPTNFTSSQRKPHVLCMETERSRGTSRLDSYVHRVDYSLNIYSPGIRQGILPLQV